jgi:hypothetical protein
MQGLQRIRSVRSRVWGAGLDEAVCVSKTPLGNCVQRIIKDSYFPRHPSHSFQILDSPPLYAGIAFSILELTKDIIYESQQHYHI